MPNSLTRCAAQPFNFKLAAQRATPATWSYKPALLSSLLLTSFFGQLQTLGHNLAQQGVPVCRGNTILAVAALGIRA